MSLSSVVKNSVLPYVYEEKMEVKVMKVCDLPRVNFIGDLVGFQAEMVEL